MGATREQVLSRYGEPRSTLVGGGRELLFYSRERLTLRNGVVVEVERVSAEPVRRPAPAPAPTPAPTQPAPATEAPAQPETPAPTTEAAAARPAPAQPTEAANPSPATPVPEPAPPEPKLEIKRVLPRGTSAPRTTQQTTAASTAAGPAPVTAAATKAAAEAAKTTSVAPTSAPATPPADRPASDSTASPAAVPASALATSTPPRTSTAPSPTAEPATTTAKATEEPPAPPAEDVSAKEAAKKAADLRAARRRREEAASDSVDPTAAAFSTRSYLFALAIIGGGIGVLAWRRRQRRLSLEVTAVSRTPFSAPVAASAGAMFTADFIAKLEWKHFEELVAAYYAKTGVVATRTKSGPDAPVHIKISWKGEPRPFALVQCLAQPTGLIEAKPIQDLTAVLMAEDIRRGYVVTTGKFNVAARDFAEEKHITLLPGEIFLEKLNALPDAARTEIMQQIAVGDYTTPVCPKCETKMTRSPEDPGVWRCAAHPEQQIRGR